MRSLILLLIAAAIAIPCTGQTAPAPSTATSPSDEEQAIRKVMDEQVAAWNHGDLEGYMASYWNSPEVMFYSGATETKGWQETLARYRHNYQGKGKTMGQLTMSNVRIEMLGPDAALVRAVWSLKLPDGSTPHGLTTLIFRRMPEGWRIIHDHSSGA